ncbi:MAG: 6-carboxytetrahydropterin synthase [Candidatus Anammoxibacter sp.]
MLFITKRLTFSSAHRLFNPELSEEENSKIFGKCSFQGGHGHNYTLEVGICGEVDSKTGMIIDIKELKGIVEREIISKLDHKNLNTDVGFLKDIIPTVENIAVKIWEILVGKIKRGKLYEIKLFETKDNVATYRG